MFGNVRIDGSVDRTQQHNVYVMAHIVKKDLETVTLFIGFGIPQKGRVSGYLDCLKKVAGEVLVAIVLPHRINLAWKSVCRIKIIAKIIGLTRQLSKHFRNSNSRAQKLKQTAEKNNFDKPLRYPAYFAMG